MLRIAASSGECLTLPNCPSPANLAETAAFMAGEKRIFIFSVAGGAGSSYHPKLGCGNTTRRARYLLEPGGWTDQANQGPGRVCRMHQAFAHDRFRVRVHANNMPA